MKNPQPQIRIRISFDNDEEMRKQEDYEDFRGLVQEVTDEVATVIAIVLRYPDYLLELFRRFVKTFNSMCTEEVRERSEESNE